jgi:hypothetical protein
MLLWTFSLLYAQGVESDGCRCFWTMLLAMCTREYCGIALLCYLSNVAVWADATVSSVIKHLFEISISVKLYLLHVNFLCRLSSAYFGFLFFQSLLFLYVSKCLMIELPYILESNPHPFYGFRRLKNQMRIIIACGLDSRSRAGFWKNDRAAVRAIRTIQCNNLLF